MEYRWCTPPHKAQRSPQKRVGKERPTQPEAVDAYNKAASSRHSRTAAQIISQQLREHAQDPGMLKADRMQNWGSEVDVTHAAEGLLGNDWVRESQFPIRSTKSGGGATHPRTNGQHWGWVWRKQWEHKVVSVEKKGWIWEEFGDEMI